MNIKAKVVDKQQYEVDYNTKDKTKVTDSTVESKGNDLDAPLLNKLTNSTRNGSRTDIASTAVDHSCPGRTLVIERANTDVKETPKSVEVFVPQRDIGEEAVVVWDAALVLSYYLERHQISLGFLQPDKRIHVVDVGAGTGVVGLVAAALGANVTLTDVDSFIPLLEEGISANHNLFSDRERTTGCHFIRALPLNWGKINEVHHLCRENNEIGGPPDLILVSDCIYYEASIAPLICTLRELASARKSAPVLLSYEDRDYSTEKKQVKENFFALAARYFLIEEVPTKDCHPEYSSDDMKIVKMVLVAT